MIKYRGQLRGSHELFQIYVVVVLFFVCLFFISQFMIDVLNLKLCFATDVLTERSGSLSEPGPFLSILIYSDLNLLMEFLYFTASKRPVSRIRD